jgi:hypothetical protein
MKLVTISRTFSPAEAHVQRSRLEAAGFAAFIKNELSAILTEGYTMPAGGIQVQVPEDQVEAARALLGDADVSADEA